MMDRLLFIWIRENSTTCKVFVYIDQIFFQFFYGFTLCPVIWILFKMFEKHKIILPVNVLLHKIIYTIFGVNISQTYNTKVDI